MLGYLDITYRIRGGDDQELSEETVSGVQVGRFAVRSTEGAPFSDPDDKAWVIDHVPTGARVAAFDSFDDAMLVADEISRFSKKDPASKNADRVKTQIGEKAGRYIGYVKRTGKAIGYRQWEAENT